MALLPRKVTLIGQDTTNPALPSYNVRGTLSIDQCILAFRGGGTTHLIPLEQIDRITPLDTTNFTLQTVFAILTFVWYLAWCFPIFGLSQQNQTVLIIIGSILLALPLAVFYVYFTPTTHDIVLTAWDENHGINATTIIRVGRNVRDMSRSRELIREIWTVRGECRRRLQKATEVEFPQEGEDIGLPLDAEPAFVEQPRQPLVKRLRMPSVSIPLLGAGIAIAVLGWGLLQLRQPPQEPPAVGSNELQQTLAALELTASAQAPTLPPTVENLAPTLTALSREIASLERDATQQAQAPGAAEFAPTITAQARRINQLQVLGTTIASRPTASSRIPEFVTELTINGRAPQGTAFIAPRHGQYQVIYSRGAVRKWNVPSDQRTNCDEPCYSIGLLALRSDTVRFNPGEGAPIQSYAHIFEWNDHSGLRPLNLYHTAEDAEESIRGAASVVQLDQNETIRFVVPDGNQQYSDNSGEIVIAIYYLGP